MSSVDGEVLKSKLTAKDFYFVTTRELPGQDGQRSVYFYGKLANGFQVFIELKLKAGVNACKVSVRSSNKALSELCKQAVSKIIM
jgi:hypothetical protein